MSKLIPIKMEVPNTGGVMIEAIHESDGVLFYAVHDPVSNKRLNWVSNSWVDVPEAYGDDFMTQTTFRSVEDAERGLNGFYYKEFPPEWADALMMYTDHLDNLDE